MIVDHQSWLVTSEVTLLPDEKTPDLEPIRVQTITFPGGVGRHGYGATPTNPSALGFDFDAFIERLRHVHGGWDYPYKASKAAYSLVNSAFEGQDRPSSVYDVGDDILNKIVVPVFGSPPSDWSTLAELLQATTDGAVTVIQGADVPVTMIVSFATMTVVVNVLSPASKAIGRGLAHKIDQFMGTPPETTPAVEAKPVVKRKK